MPADPAALRRLAERLAELWGIRHVRWAWGYWRVYRWAMECSKIGLGYGHPNGHDISALDAIWRGER